MADEADTRADGRELRRLNFIVQQGFLVPDGAACDARYGALLFQPRLVLGWTLIALVLGSASLFATLGAILRFCAAAPHRNPFEALYNAIVARRGGVRLTPAPAPRRFSQLLGGFCFGSFLYHLLLGRVGFAWRTTPWGQGPG